MGRRPPRSGISFQFCGCYLKGFAKPTHFLLRSLLSQGDIYIISKCVGDVIATNYFCQNEKNRIFSLNISKNISENNIFQFMRDHFVTFYRDFKDCMRFSKEKILFLYL